MKVYQERKKITLVFSPWGWKRYAEVNYGSNNTRLLLAKKQVAMFDNSKTYQPADNFVLSAFFDLYMEQAFIDYSHKSKLSYGCRSRFALLPGHNNIKMPDKRPHCGYLQKSSKEFVRQYFGRRSLILDLEKITAEI